MAPIAPGQLLAARFEILRPLGAGGLAEVFAARDRVTGAEVAIKALHDHLARDPALAERFRRELAVTRSLDHPGIVRVYDLYSEGGRPFFSMELLRGETLADRLRRGRVPPDEARAIARDIARALGAAHRHGVIHRDLKPQNVFLPEGGGVKLVDFGLARAAGWARLTAQSTVMGTPGYLAPEVLSGSGADPRADVYSLGAILFELLTGKRAFSGLEPVEVLRRQSEPPPSPRALEPAVSVADDALVRRALAPDPEERFVDLDQFLRALGGEVLPAPAPPPLPLTAGDVDVILHSRQGQFRKQRRALKAVLERLGAKPSRAWRYGPSASRVLVAGASRRTAEQVALLCQEHGLPATIEQSKKPGKLSAWLAQRALPASVVAGAAVATGFGSVLAHNAHGTEPILALLAATLAVAVGPALATWNLLARHGDAPIRGLPKGDPSVRRLVDGIARRAQALKARAAALPPASQLLVADLVAAADHAASVAAELADAAAAAPDPLAAGSEEPTLLTAAPAQRDALVGRLLEIAASLDDALVTAQPASTASASQALARLREEITFARRALPVVDAARRGADALAPPDAPTAEGPPALPTTGRVSG